MYAKKVESYARQRPTPSGVWSCDGSHRHVPYLSARSSSAMCSRSLRIVPLIPLTSRMKATEDEGLPSGSVMSCNVNSTATFLPSLQRAGTRSRSRRPYLDCSPAMTLVKPARCLSLCRSGTMSCKRQEKSNQGKPQAFHRVTDIR